MNTFEKVREVIVDCLCVDEVDVTMDAKLIEDLGADSLDLAGLFMELEVVPDEEAEKLKTVGQVVEYIDKRQTSK
ncbi:acyl carrier protein [Anaerospora hongkongensis]|uniref:Acyl carrier protein n=1 Tax=Anaerospora hongkongensis TaxID=244830 RepID=A0A4R1Q4M8_9FIRM|nr:acyl carrier protein [Anaerospora hongkongensis]TCL39972.1 acyl carrier protein [Anaerospora hongkongensis]